VQNILPLEQF